MLVRSERLLSLLLGGILSTIQDEDGVHSMPPEPTNVLCSCWRCVDEKHPNGRPVTRYLANKHRRHDWSMVEHAAHTSKSSKRHLALTDMLELSDEESDSASMSPHSSTAPDRLLSDRDPSVSPDTMDAGGAADMEDLTGNLTQLSMEADSPSSILNRRITAGRESVWELPDDAPTLDSDEDATESDEEDSEIAREWQSQEDADAYGFLNVGADELTADEILQGKFIAETVRDSKLSDLDRAICRILRVETQREGYR
ncbi:hypothetical protein R3P38DRAFT_2777228 [Favolaschia claudopus]|uniref:Uncharacterized protein n=1 Tax=Favolaschia claudopus TaxID=2862362 RepID=A0AAW0BL87_9AGAR